MRAWAPGLARVLRIHFLALTVVCTYAASLAAAQQPPKAGDDGEDLMQRKQYSGAMDRFEATLATAPNDLRARRGEVAAANAWAADQAQEGHPEAAMQILERALGRLPNEPVLLVSFGLEAISLGQFPIADQALHAAEKIQSGDPTTTYALARLEIEEQHLPEAERDLKRYLAARSDDASAYFGLGHVYAMEQRNDDARRAFKASLKLQPQQTASPYQLGQIALNLQDDLEARADFNGVLARDPNHAGALTGMGQLALRAGQYAEAERYLLQAERSDPSYVPSHYYRGLALAKLGRTEEAQAEMRKGDSRPHVTVPQATGAP